MKMQFFAIFYKSPLRARVKDNQKKQNKTQKK